MKVKKIIIICEDKDDCGKALYECPFQQLKDLPRRQSEKILGVPIPWYEPDIELSCFNSERELAEIYLELAKIRGE